MAKEPASVQLTGGAGFEFEDQAAAFFATAMLAGTQPLGPAVGGVFQLDWQTRESGWLLDDLLVSVARPEKGRLALSIKSDRQVTGSGFPDSFVTALWEQRLGKGTPASDFSMETDFLGLVVGELGNEVEENWNELLRQCLNLASNPSRLVTRYTTEVISSPGGRALFESLRCPAEVSTTATDLDLASLLARVRLIHLDFTSPTSRYKADAINVIQRTLTSGDAKEAASLWEVICRICATRRIAGGSMSRVELLTELRHRFSLADAPNFAAAWVRLQELSRDHAAWTKLHIGRDIRLDRREQVLQLKALILERSCVLVSGSTGSGKSAIVRTVVEDTSFCSRFLWLDADVVADTTPTELQARLGSAIPLATLLAETTPSLSILVLDGLDRFSSKGLVTVASLLGSLSHPLSTSGWAVLATTRAESAVDLSSRLRQVGVDDFAGHAIHPLSSTAIRGALDRLPTVRHLALRPAVVDALRNLKVFDWVASVVQTGSNPSPDSWVGMMDVLDWIWESWIGNGPGRIDRANALKELGSAEAETLVQGVGLLSVEQLGGRVVDELQHLDLIRVDEERVLFTHDLVGDVARLRVLLDFGSDTSQLVHRVQHPRWHAAVRLLGQRLAERTTSDNRVWKHAFEATDDSSTAGALYRNLLIEGVCLAVNAGQLVELLWPDLVASDGLLLRRLLEAFRYTATIPDPRIRGISSNPESQAELEANVRLPYWPYWLPLLAILPGHIADLCRLAPVETGQVVGLWLRTMPIGIAGRKEAAALALAIAKEVQAARAVHFRAEAEEEEVIFQALLNAAPELPDEVSQVCLELAQRRPEPTAVTERRQKYQEEERQRLAEWVEKNPPKKLATGLSVFDEGVMTKPLPDGPAAQVDRGFQRTVLGGPSITALAMARPTIAREVLIASALRPPHRARFWDDDDPLHHYGIESVDRADPPFYSRGPWSALLQVDPALAVDVIVKLVNHATDSWAMAGRRFQVREEHETEPPPPQVHVFVDGHDRTWVGDSRVFGWYRNHLIGSHTIVSALMALEKFLYDHIDAGRSVETVVRRIWEESTSVAMVGVLSALANRNPSLLEGPLLPLLGVWQLHDWNHRLVMNESVWMIERLQWARYGQEQFDMFQKWNTLPHRKLLTLNRFVEAFITRTAVQTAFDGIRERWRREAESDPDSAPDIRRLSARFDLNNYAITKHDETSFAVSFDWPAELKAETSKQGEQAQKSMAFLTFPHRCRQLLEKDEPLSDTAAEALWNEMQELSKFQLAPETDEEFGPVRQRADVVAAGITVLAILASEWLERNENHVHWCAEELVSIGQNPPRPPRFDIPESVTTDAWHCFLAELAVSELASDPNDEQARAWAAQGVMSRWHSSIRLAMERAFRLRDKLGEDFPRLANLAAMYAALLGTRYHFDETGQELKRFAARYDRLVGAFLRRTIPSGSLNWSEVGRVSREAHERLDRKRFPAKYERKTNEGQSSGDTTMDTSIEGRLRQTLARRDRTPRVYPGYDLHVLAAGLGWLPSALGVAGADRVLALSFLEGLLAVSLGMLATVDADDGLDGDDQIEGTPYDFDGWVFDLVVQALPLLDDAPAAQFWRPILDLGPSAHYWVESFCDSWHAIGLDKSPSREQFFTRWNEMISHAESSPVWSPAPGAAHYRLGGLWEHLLGMGIGARVVGAIESEAFLAQMGPVYQRWATRWLRNSLGVRSLCRLLLQPGARSLRLAMLPSLCTAVKGLSDYRRDRDDVDHLVIRVLRLVWSDSSNQLAADAGCREPFLELVSLLAADQSADALHLRDTVAKSLRTN